MPRLAPAAPRDLGTAVRAGNKDSTNDGQWTLVDGLVKQVLVAARAVEIAVGGKAIGNGAVNGWPSLAIFEDGVLLREVALLGPGTVVQNPNGLEPARVAAPGLHTYDVRIRGFIAGVTTLYGPSFIRVREV